MRKNILSFFKRNSGQIALIIILAFIALPFIYSNDEGDDYPLLNEQSEVSYQIDLISHAVNKITSFYGLSKPEARLTSYNQPVISIKEKVSLKDNSIPQAEGKTQAQIEAPNVTSNNEQPSDLTPAPAATQEQTKENTLNDNLQADQPQNTLNNEQQTISIKELKFTKDTNSFVSCNGTEKGDILFVETDDYNSAYYEWGTPVIINIDGKDESGMILPQFTGDKKKKLKTPDNLNIENIEQITANVERINDVIDSLREIVANSLPNNTKVYINSDGMDSQLSELMQGIMTKNTKNGKAINYITKNRDKADIILPGLILTPSSFEKFYNNFNRQLQSL